MKNKIKRMKIMILRRIALLLFITLMASPVWALTTGGTPIIAIDGDGDYNVNVDILSVGFTAPYTYGYFLNGSSTFSTLAGGISINTFTGGDIIDFALYDSGINRYYTLSGDSADSSYSVAMTFANPVTVGAAQQPAGWTLPYYYNANMTWSLPPNVLNTNELALNFINNGNDGIAPVSVPEPATLLLLGSGLLGLGYFRRNRKKY